MYRNQVYFLISSFYFTFLSVTIVLCRASFQISQLNECPPQDSKFITLVDRSLEQCVEECSLRRVCDVVGYKRSLRLCELHISSSSPPVVDNHCVLIYRKDIDGPPPKCNCAEWMVCDTSASNGHCSIHECEPQSPPEDGKYLGNKNTVGSTKAVMCNHGYIEMNKIKSIKCMETGKWSNTVSCVRIDCGAVPNLKNGTVTLDISQNSTYGSSASVRCEQEYETETSKIICPITGSWSVPVCRPKDCGSVPVISNGTVTLDKPSETTYQSTASVNCDVGYEPETSSITCSSTGGWPQTSCHLKCPSSDGWLNLTDTFEVQFHLAEKTQSKAKKLCNETIGGRLVVLDELWKMDNITTVLKRCTDYRNRKYWTDGDNMEDSQEWRFSSGISMPEFWQPDEPDSFPLHNCVTVSSSKAWNNRRCDNKSGFICEKTE